jgi:hypothetical protein
VWAKGRPCSSCTAARTRATLPTLTLEKQASIQQLASCTVAEAIELMRPEFEAYVAQLDPTGADDATLARKWVDGLHPLDAAVLAQHEQSELAAAAREPW